MKPGKIQCLLAALPAALLLASSGKSGLESAAVPSPTASPTPVPSPTPRLIPVVLHFQRPARIIPVYREDGEAEIPSGTFEIADETPWLTEKDIRWISQWPEEFPGYLQFYLTPQGVKNFSEAAMGNFGRKVILVIDGTARTVAPLEKIMTKREDRIDFYADFSPREVEKILAQVIAPQPVTPSPAPSPTPPRPRDRFIIR